MTSEPPVRDPRFAKLIEFLKRIPAIQHNDMPGSGFGAGYNQNDLWWIKLGIDIEHPLAWSVVQEFGHVLSVSERLPTAFMPVSSPPYMNGGPREFLSWLIESKSPDFSPDRARGWLEGRLPRPVEDGTKWPISQEDQS